ncbi:hypothetical protein GJAV_G00174930 [Gymnothorax javanicus]|nr:hypothetical protein GJAV_G00174930 [Gymnothorax javanicus]
MTFLHGQLAVGLLYLSLSLSESTAFLEKIDLDAQPAISCEQGLIGCTARDEVIQSPDSSYVHVRKLDVKAFLCCRRGRDCRPCLCIQTQITVNGPLDDSELSGSNGYGWAEEEGFVSLCSSISNGMPVCKRVEFIPTPPALEGHHNAEAVFSLSLLLLDKVYYGSVLLVSAQTLNQTIIVPSLREVCSSELRGYVKACNVPILQAVINKEKEVALLQLEQGMNSTALVEICQKYGQDGECIYQQWNETNASIPLDSVATCLCFQVRKKDSDLAWETCPFRNSREFFERTWRKVQVSFSPAVTNSGEPALVWNLTAPCRLKAELWLCRIRGSPVGQDCSEEDGSRRLVENRMQGGWQRDLQSHWVTGEFLGFVPDPSLCVQVLVNGTDRPMDPICLLSTTKHHWVFPVVLSTLVICVGVLGACCLHSSLKGWVSCWSKDDTVRGVVCRKQVVLLGPPESDPNLAVLVSRLGTALCSLGFGVIADLWSQAELGVLGPVPWLHGQLERLKRVEGQVVLILTPGFYERVGQRGGVEAEAGKEERGLSPHVDVFNAALNCLLADRLHSINRGHFTLVHFEVLPSFSPISSWEAVKPLSFHGLQPYALPSQSLPFLVELTGQSSVRLWPASRTLDRALRGFGVKGPRSGITEESMTLMGSQTHKDWSKDIPLV